LPEESQDDISKLDKAITKAMHGMEKTMWEGVFWGGSQQKIIGYGELTYTNSKKQKIEWFTIGLALQKNYITVYVNAVQSGLYLAENFKDKLGKAKVGKSTITFKKLEDINIEDLLEVVKRAYELSKESNS